MKKNNYCVIMAGGVGSRFWPFSRNEKPKQFLDFFGTGRSLLQMTIDRFRPLVPIENILIVTNVMYRDQVLEQIPDMQSSQVLCEPARRNTAPCIAYAVARIKAMAKGAHANIVVAASDHLILQEDKFRDTIAKCFDFIEEEDALVTLGMKPTRPETGYGYIQFSAEGVELSDIDGHMQKVKAFTEKPSQEVAKKFVESGDFLWNSGIFIWNVSTIVNAFRVYQSPIASIFESLLPYYDTAEEQAMVNERFPECRNISVDYAIMERADEIFVFPSNFGWSDLGTWVSLHDNAHKDLNGNAALASGVSFVESRNCVVNTKNMSQVVVIGMNDCIVAENDGRLLVCRMDEEGHIKEFSGEK